MTAPHYSCIIFDLGDVLFTWSPTTTTSISPKRLHQFFSTQAWHDFERGTISQDDCYKTLGLEFNIDPAEIHQAFTQARESLSCNDELVSFIRDLKSQAGLRVFAMSNISAPDYAYMRAKPGVDWSIFDHVFASGVVGHRKPNLSFFRHVLETAGVNPHNTIFVDDKEDNILCARTLGLEGIVFDNTANVTRQLRNLIGNPVRRGWEYLAQNAKCHQSLTNGGVRLKENFIQLLILESTGDRSLVSLVEHERTWNFFQDKNDPTVQKEFPDDADTTAVALTVANIDPSTIRSVMDEMLTLVNDDGIMMTYFGQGRERFDPVVCVNVLTLFYTHERGHQLERTLNWVYDTLLNRAYINGTRYYETPECFLYFLTRLLACTDDKKLHSQFDDLFHQRVKERIGADGDPLALAMRLLAVAFVGLRDDVDLQKLRYLQCADGGWTGGWLYRYGTRTSIKGGNRGLTTALAIKAIQAFDTPICGSPGRSSLASTLVEVRPPTPPPTKKVETTRSKYIRRISAAMQLPAKWLHLSAPSTRLDIS